MSPTLEEAHQKVREEGITVRNPLLGEAYLKAAAANGPPSHFLQAGLDMISEAAFGLIWTRPGLEKKQRSLIAISMIATLGKIHELKIHVNVGLRNGLTVDKIKECLLQVMIYGGIPTGLEAFRAADEAIQAYTP